MTTASIDVGPFTLTGEIPPVDGVGEAYAPRRKVLDGILVEAATRSGVDLWEGCTVDELLLTEDTDGTGSGGPRVGGVRGHRAGGRPFSAKAPVVVAADGMRSPLARLLKAPTYLERSPRLGVYFTYWSGVPVSEPTLYTRPYRSIAAFPTNDDLTVIGVNWAIDDYTAVRKDIEDNYLRTIREVSPDLAERLHEGRREERWIGTTVPSFFRRPYGPGWALVGDAGYLKDACTAQGITDAFHHAQLLADALDAVLRGHRTFAAALGDYERRRNEAVMAMYEFTYDRSGLEPPTPEMMELLGAMRCDQKLIERFLGVFAGTVPVQDFFGAAVPSAAA